MADERTPDWANERAIRRVADELFVTTDLKD